MKKYLFLALPIVLISADMPPMPPMIPGIGAPSKTSKNLQKSNLPKSCEMIPPMIYKLPPPLEKLLTTCKNDLAKPSIKKATKIFGKQIKDITSLEGFSQVYKVEFISKKEKTLYCNKDLNFCFKQAPTNKLR